MDVSLKFSRLCGENSRGLSELWHTATIAATIAATATAERSPGQVGIQKGEKAGIFVLMRQADMAGWAVQSYFLTTFGSDHMSTGCRCKVALIALNVLWTIQGACNC